MNLTTAQHAKLDKLPESIKVIGSSEQSLILRYPDQRTVCLSAAGRITRASTGMLLDLYERRGRI